MEKKMEKKKKRKKERKKGTEPDLNPAPSAVCDFTLPLHRKFFI